MGCDLRIPMGQLGWRWSVEAETDRCCPLCWARMGHKGWQRNGPRQGACSGWADGPERDDTGLVAAELGDVVAVGGQQGDLGVDDVLESVEPGGYEKFRCRSSCL